MSQPQLLKKIIEILNRAGLEYMLTGSLVSSLQGEPRLTHDIDIVVSITEQDIFTLTNAFPPPRYYLDPQSIHEAIGEQSTFNLIDGEEGDKIDFWLLTGEPFDKSRFTRKYVQDISGVPAFVSAPEDTILVKLKWAKLSGGSEKQFVDALRVFEVQYAQLDLVYMDHWAENLDVLDYWARLKKEAVIE